ncbi:hypothetical protein [Pseudoalteromonas sp. SR43-5]|uniref:hypothetical protein n=1 Tax=Pseudoalteromonas sp. SR43-5 TaxID=2760941 RepID=UPI0015FA6746|nr:hypothetical protein [Pseudoalteromonas sp. SR43-5]MBB1307246.1 hypothetical protein [Pseudoalteromonas sp. SR43-5]
MIYEIVNISLLVFEFICASIFTFYWYKKLKGNSDGSRADEIFYKLVIPMFSFFVFATAGIVVIYWGGLAIFGFI